MRSVLLATCSVICAVSGCGENAGVPAETSAGNAQPAAQRGGTIAVAGETWTFVPSISCSVYPGPTVNLAGHAAEEPNLEIVIDWGGPNQARIAETDSGPGWHAVRETLDVQVDGRRVTGSATFSEYFTGTGERAEGSFDIQC